MLRGVNKYIIEINDVGSEFFEKALFFVKANNTTANSKLEKEAQKIMESFFDVKAGEGHTGYLRYTEQKKQNRKKNLVFSICITIVATAVATAIFFAFN